MFSAAKGANMHQVHLAQVLPLSLLEETDDGGSPTRGQREIVPCYCRMVDVRLVDSVVVVEKLAINFARGS